MDTQKSGFSSDQSKGGPFRLPVIGRVPTAHTSGQRGALCLIPI